jgi:N-methylhydantoinase A
MPAAQREQTSAPILIGVDVGGTFTDLVAWDSKSGQLRIVKVPSTPPEFERAVIEAVRRGLRSSETAKLVHGSTVATNALLQRAGEPVAFVTTQGFRDMLLIGRQNRPQLYNLRVRRPVPIASEANWFTVRERIGANGDVVEALDPAAVDNLISQILNLKLKHVAVCLLFSFVNPLHEQMIGQRCEAAGLTVSLSSDLLPEFREYERASTTTINASLRPTVAAYLESLSTGLPEAVRDLRIMHSGGGTLDPVDAAKQAGKLVLSGPAGGVIGAAYVAQRAGFGDVITYDMGGTSTDVAMIRNGQPQWTTSSTIDGLPIGLPMFDIHTVGAGGGSIAQLDSGGALRVGPHSAGAIPGPACYGRGGTYATVTDANLVLGRILPDSFLGGEMRLDVDAVRRAVGAAAERMGKSLTDAALGIVKVAEANMAHAVRAVSSRRGHDPRRFALVSFGGAGGLHACALAESLEMSRVIVPPYCGVLSALGMIVAPPVADASRTVVQMADRLDDERLAAEFGFASEMTMRQIPYEQTASVEAYADVRFRGQSHELKVRIERPSRSQIEQTFIEAYGQMYGRVPSGRAIEIVTLRVRRFGRAAHVELPRFMARAGEKRSTQLVVGAGQLVQAEVYDRAALCGAASPRSGPFLVIDPEATTYVPLGWGAAAREDGTLILERTS